MMSLTSKSTDMFILDCFGLCLICAYFSSVSPLSGENNIMDTHFSQKQRFEAKNILMMNLFLTNIQLSALKGVN